MRMVSRLLIVCLIAVVIGGCDDKPKMRLLSADATVLAFGDSLTFGTGTSAENSYPVKLQQLIGREVIRSGVPGEQTAAGLKRLPGVLEEVQPELVILCHGGNDILRRKSKARAQENLIAMINMIEASGAQVLLLAVPQFGLFLPAAEFITNAAEITQVRYEPDLIPDLQTDKSIKSDTVHFNAQGYSLLAEGVFQALQDAGAI